MNTVTKADAPAIFRSGWWAILRHTLFEPAIDLIFPAVCSGCGKVGMALCPDCQNELRASYPPILHAPHNTLQAVAALGPFEHSLRRAIHALKYENERILAAPLGKLMAERIRTASWPPGLIVPVPLHVERLAQRGYNQAALLAECAAQELGWPVTQTGLSRHRATTSQVGLGYHERQENVREAFSVIQPELFRNADVILVDDVYTTGATLSACALELLSSGARSVRASVVGMAQGGTQGDIHSPVIL